jgi:hypothetical protein
LLPTRTAALLAVAIGVGLEVWISLATGRREAWDSGLYWTVALPVAVVAAGAIGYLSRGNAWLAALLIVPGQVLAMAYRSGSIGSLTLWPLTLALSCLLGLPFALVAYVGQRLRRRSSGSARR